MRGWKLLKILSYDKEHYHSSHISCMIIIKPTIMIKFLPDSFSLDLTIPHECWYKEDQSTGKYNRAYGVTSLLSSVKRNTIEVMWRPAAIEGQFLLMFRVWDTGKKPKDSSRHSWGVFDVKSGEKVNIKCFINNHTLNPLLHSWVTFEIRRKQGDEPRLLEENFNGPWYALYREILSKNNNDVKSMPNIDFDWG